LLLSISLVESRLQDVAEEIIKSLKLNAQSLAFHYSSREKFNNQQSTMEKRSDLLSINIFQKIHLHKTRPHIRNCTPKLDFEQVHCLRSIRGIPLLKL
jgi:hypothetical protein